MEKTPFVIFMLPLLVLMRYCIVSEKDNAVSDFLYFLELVIFLSIFILQFVILVLSYKLDASIEVLGPASIITYVISMSIYVFNFTKSTDKTNSKGVFNTYFIFYFTYAMFQSTSFAIHFITRIVCTVVMFSVMWATVETPIFVRSLILGVVAVYLIEIPTYFMFRDRCRLFMAQKTSASSESSLRSMLNVIPEGFAIFGQ